MNKNQDVVRIRFHYLDTAFHFSNRTALKRFLLGQFAKHKRRVEIINYVFCTDVYLLSLNQSYLKHDTYTDIITFELSKKGDPLLADIYISVDRVQDNAKKFGQKFQSELLRVIMHGALHLCGYKDKTKRDQDAMRQAEDNWIRLYNVPREKTS